MTVRDSKFGKSRELPLHTTTVTALREYLRIRDAHQHAGPQRRVPDLAGRNPADLLQRARDLPTAPSRRGPDCALVGVPPDGFTISATGSRCRRCSIGTATASTCHPGCRC